MTINVHSGLAGRFKLEAVRIDQRGIEHRRPLTGWVDNLITDYGLDRMGQIDGRHNVVVSVQVGSGSTAPANSDVNLAAHVATASKLTSDYPMHGYTSPYNWRRWNWRFEQGAAAGNLSEIGVGTTGEAGALFSRALILDGDGNPATITVLATEFLDVTYELRIYPPTGDTVTTETIQGESYTVTRRPYRVQYAETWRNNAPAVYYYTDLEGFYLGHQASGSEIVDETSTIPGLVNGGNRSRSSYVSGSYSLDMTSMFDIGSANFDKGIASVVSNTQCGAFQYGFSPTIPKDNTKQFTITTRHTWGRYAP